MRMSQAISISSPDGDRSMGSLSNRIEEEYGDMPAQVLFRGSSVSSENDKNYKNENKKDTEMKKKDESSSLANKVSVDASMSPSAGTPSERRYAEFPFPENWFKGGESVASSPYRNMPQSKPQRHSPSLRFGAIPFPSFSSIDRELGKCSLGPDSVDKPQQGVHLDADAMSDADTVATEIAPIDDDSMDRSMSPAPSSPPSTASGKKYPVLIESSSRKKRSREIPSATPATTPVSVSANATTQELASTVSDVNNSEMEGSTALNKLHADVSISSPPCHKPFSTSMGGHQDTPPRTRPRPQDNDDHITTNPFFLSSSTSNSRKPYSLQHPPLKDESTSANALRGRKSFDSHDSSVTTASGIATDHTSTTTSTPFQHFGFNGGFSARNGQFSFTGSPIEEIACAETNCSVSEEDDGFMGCNTKIRRLNLHCETDSIQESLSMEYNTSNDGHDGRNREKGYHSRRKAFASNGRNESEFDDTMEKKQLFVDCQSDSISDNGDSGKSEDRISPTDVSEFPFPAGSPSYVPPLSTPVQRKKQVLLAPPSPSRIAPPSSPHMYNPQLPPEMPVTQRKSARRKRFPFSNQREEEDDGLSPSNSNGGQIKSRFMQDFEIIGTLGNGSCGTVHKCLSRLDGCMYAVKATKRQAKGKTDRDNMLKEVKALANLWDLAETAAFHIVRYHQAWMEENRLYIQMELCTSTLQAEMQRGGGISVDPNKRYTMLREILLALDLVHRNGMVHLDIKPENIFIKNDQFKLGDFGLVSKISVHEDVEEGDCRYLSKELLSGNHEDLTKCDIFSLGITMYEICVGRPLPGEGQEWQDIRAGNLSPMQHTRPELQRIIKDMMNPDPSKRPTASALLKRRQLLSNEQKQLIREQNKVLEANMALKTQQDRLNSKLSPPKKTLIRANTWNASRY